MKTNKRPLDDTLIAQEVRTVEASILAVWKRLADGFGEASYELRTIVLSDSMMWVANVKYGGRDPIISSEKLSTPEFELGVTDKYMMHAIPTADFHGKSRKEVKRVWAERNAALIREKENKDIILIVTTEKIFHLFADELAVEVFTDMVERGDELVRKIRLKSAAEAMLWKPNSKRVEDFLRAIQPSGQTDFYRKMSDTLKANRPQ